MTEPDIDEILEKFPFSHRRDQQKKLAQIMLQWPGKVKHVREETGISWPTLKEIRDTYQDLPLEEKKRLNHRLYKVMDRMLEEEIQAKKAAQS